MSAQLLNRPILSIQTGQVIGFLARPILTPEKLEIVAFWCQATKESKLTNSPRYVVLARDLRRLSPDAAVVDSIEELEDPNEIVRLATILRQPINLIGIDVQNESNVKLGKVDEYTINLEQMLVQKLYVRPPLLKRFLVESMMVDRSQIIEITPRQVTVRDTTIKQPTISTQPATPD
jgi:sporulation protein YlmC with PRC-barrel domain